MASANRSISLVFALFRFVFNSSLICDKLPLSALTVANNAGGDTILRGGYYVSYWA
jgi:hypothetical protein